MAHITEAQFRDLARRGRIDPAEVARIDASRKEGNRQATARKAATLAALRRVALSEPVEFTIPLDLYTENRLRAMHPINRGKHVKAQRVVVRNAWGLHFRNTIPALPVVVTFTRCARRMDAHDSLPAAFKHVTDEVTEMLGLKNDDTPLVRWVYAQQPRGSEPNAIRIRVEREC